MYWIYIDESMSINGQPNGGDFSISLVIINESNYRRTKSSFKRFIKKFKSINKLDNVEIKGELLKKMKAIDFLETTLEACLEGNNFICAHIANNGIQEKWLKNKSATYNFMVKCAIERAIERGMIAEGDDLRILSDNRNISNDYKKSLQEYLNIQLSLENNHNLTIIHDYVDSKLNWGVQLADFLSFRNNRLIIKSRKNNIKLPFNFRQIY